MQEEYLSDSKLRYPHGKTLPNLYRPSRSTHGPTVKVAISPTVSPNKRCVGNHWIHRDRDDEDAKFYRRDEIDARLKGVK